MGGGGGEKTSGNINQATAAQVQAAQQAQAANQGYLSQAEDLTQSNNKLSVGSLNTGYNQARNQLSPYNFAGLNALDSLQTSMGQATTPGGSFALQQALTNNQKINDFGRLYQMAVMSDPNTAGKGQPLDNTHLTAAIWKDPQYAGNLGHSITSLATQIYQKGGPQNQSEKEFIAQYNSMGGTSGMTGDQFLTQNDITSDKLTTDQRDLVTKYNNGTLGKDSTYDKNSALGAFFNSPQYQLLFNGGGKTTDPTATVQERFQADPGYQFALDTGRRNLEASKSSQGLLQSTSFAKDLTDYSQGVANQQYQGYLGNLTSTFDKYQGNLMSLAGIGANTASQNAGYFANQGTALAGQYNLNTQMTNPIYTAMGDNAANSYLAQGAAQAGGYLNQANESSQQGAKKSSMMGTIGGVAGGLIGTYFGGPVGGMAGSQIGSSIGGAF